MKEIKDYLHLYLGCDIQYPDTIEGKTVKAKLTGFSKADGVETTYKRKKNNCVGDYLSWKPNGSHDSDALHIKLILRPLSSMTFDEQIQTSFTTENGISWYTPESIRFLLSKGFDLFGLIEDGLAIAATTTALATP